MQACRDYIKTTRRRISFEYALMDGVNDSDQQAHQLANLLGNMLAHVNLIPLNPTADSHYRGSSASQVRTFRTILQARGLPTTLRLRRGIDIQAGCGQLRARHGLEKS
jgi:23S rRNA (adenine2503-C2)-methyltransferase